MGGRGIPIRYVATNLPRKHYQWGVSERTKRRAAAKEGVPNGVIMANGKSERCYKALGRCSCHVCDPRAHEWPGFKASDIDWGSM